MKLSIVTAVFSAVAFSFAAVAVPTNAHAETSGEAGAPPAVACVGGQFGDHVEGGKVQGDSSAIFAAKKAVYAVDIANPGEATQVTLVWTLDGHEVQRQSLDVGHSGRWHTWGIRPLGNAKKIDVEVLDASGRSLKTDTVSSS